MQTMNNMNMMPMPFQSGPMQHTTGPRQTLYVGDLEDQIDELTLYHYFSTHGRIFSVRVMRHSDTKKSRGFGFVTFYDMKEADQARLQSNHEKIISKPIRVTWKKNMREIDKDANIFIKNLHPDVTVKDLESHMSQYGKIFTSKIAINASTGLSRGYGYIQFESRQDADACLKQAQNIVIREKQVQLQFFEHQKQRNIEDIRNNLYIKNIPGNIEQSEIESKLRAVCQQYGTIVDMVFKKDIHFQCHFGFICFQSHEQAAQALQELPGQEPFESGKKLYVGWAEKKEQRKSKLIDQYRQKRNETNLYTKNLKQTTTMDDLKNAFQIFGEITELAIKSPSGEHKPKSATIKTNFGYLNFKYKEEAQKALSQAKKEPAITALYDGDVFLSFHYSKDQLSQYRETVRRKPPRVLPPSNNMLNTQQAFMQNMQNMQFNPMGMMQMQQQFMNQQRMRPMMQNQMGNMFMPQNQYMNRKPNQQNRRPFNNQQVGGMNPLNQRPQNSMNNNKQNNRGRGRGGNYQNQNNRPINTTRNEMDNQQLPGPFNMEQNQNNVQSTPNSNSMPIQNNIQPVTNSSDIEQLRNRLSEFLSYSDDEKRKILGGMLFPRVEKCAKEKTFVPKITGMLVDFDVFEVNEIMEFLENETILTERVREAEELLIESSGK